MANFFTDISVVVVSWNSKDLLAECLHSVYRDKTQCELECIVVDNASSDGGPNLVRSLFPKAKLIINKENYGFAKANNIGISISRGKYICLMNSDAIALPGCFDSICNYLDCNENVGILGPKVFNTDFTLQPSCREFPTVWKNICRAFALDKVFPSSGLLGGYFMGSWSHDTVKEVDYLSGCFLVARKDAINSTGYLDEKFFFYAEDKDWCKRFWENGWKVVYYPQAKVVHHLGGSSNKNLEKYYLQEIKANLQYYAKHHKKWDQRVNYLILILHQIVRIYGSLLKFVFIFNKTDQISKTLNKSLFAINWLLKLENK